MLALGRGLESEQDILFFHSRGRTHQCQEPLLIQGSVCLRVIGSPWKTRPPLSITRGRKGKIVTGVTHTNTQGLEVREKSCDLHRVRF
jgi:hypothetical protein